MAKSVVQHSPELSKTVSDYITRYHEASDDKYLADGLGKDTLDTLVEQGWAAKEVTVHYRLTERARKRGKAMQANVYAQASRHAKTKIERVDDDDITYKILAFLLLPLWKGPYGILGLQTATVPALFKEHAQAKKVDYGDYVYTVMDHEYFKKRLHILGQMKIPVPDIAYVHSSY